MEAIYNFDCNILNAIQQSMRCEFLDSFTLALSCVTASGIIWVVLGVTMLLFRKTRTSGIIMLISLTVVFLAGDVLLKHLINRSRPYCCCDDVLYCFFTALSLRSLSHGCLCWIDARGVMCVNGITVFKADRFEEKSTAIAIGCL